MCRLHFFAISLVFLLGSWGATASEKAFLFQSVYEVNTFLVIPRDIKRPVLIYTVPKNCGDCLKKAEAVLATLADESKDHFRFIILTEKPLWRLSRAEYGPDSSIRKRLRKFVWHDPGSRYLSELSNSSQGLFVGYSSAGKILFQEPYSAHTTSAYLIKKVLVK